MNIRLKCLEQLEDNWDGNGSCKPQLASIQRADLFLSTTKCITPDLISAADDGIIFFEWYDAQNTFTLYFDQITSFIKIDHSKDQYKILDGRITSHEHFYILLNNFLRIKSN